MKRNCSRAPLDCCAGRRDTRFLLAAGADAGAEEGYALYGACFRGYLQVVAEALLDRCDAGRTHALHAAPQSRAYQASIGGRTECCDLLLERGADIEVAALC